jgi:hypothetical protein
MTDPLKAPPTKDFASDNPNPGGRSNSYSEPFVEMWPGTVEAVNKPFGPDQVAKNKYGEPNPQ